MSVGFCGIPSILKRNICNVCGTLCNKKNEADYQRLLLIMSVGFCGVCGILWVLVTPLFQLSPFYSREPQYQSVKQRKLIIELFCDCNSSRHQPSNQGWKNHCEWLAYFVGNAHTYLGKSLISNKSGFLFPFLLFSLTSLATRVKLD